MYSSEVRVPPKIIFGSFLSKYDAGNDTRIVRVVRFRAFWECYETDAALRIRASRLSSSCTFMPAAPPAGAATRIVRGGPRLRRHGGRASPPLTMGAQRMRAAAVRMRLYPEPA